MFDESPGDGGGAGVMSFGFGLGVERGFKLKPGGVELGGENFRFRCADEVELADSDAVFGLDGRPEDAAGDGARGVEVAGSGGGVERGARLVVGEIFVIWVGFVELAGGGVSGEAGR